MTDFILLLTAYLLGSIPFGLLLMQLTGGGDIRQTGSGNIGATNVLRSGGKKLAALTLLCDCGKALAAIWLVWYFNDTPQLIYLAGIAVIIGHIFPIWLKFKGGKGIACYFGALLGLHPLSFVIALASWAGIFFLTRISSLSALVMLGVSAAALLFFLGKASLLFLGVAIPLILFAHRDNIRRLLRGEEKAFKR